jgi:hypothetical protein
MSTMASFALIIVVLAMTVDIKNDASKRPVNLDGVSVDVVKVMYHMIGVM